MITVYFENSAIAVKVATFEDEMVYVACSEVLELTAKKMGFTYVTETIDEEKEDDNSREQT